MSDPPFFFPAPRALHALTAPLLSPPPPPPPHSQWESIDSEGRITCHKQPKPKPKPRPLLLSA
jgi:hypothetical protein